MNKFFKKIAGTLGFGHMTDEERAQDELRIRKRFEEYNALATEEAGKHSYVPALFDSDTIDVICLKNLLTGEDWSLETIHWAETENQERRRQVGQPDFPPYLLVKNEYEIQNLERK